MMNLKKIIKIWKMLTINFVNLHGKNLNYKQNN